MKIPAVLSKGLDDAKLKQLESDLKHSILGRQLRKVLNEKIESNYEHEEQVIDQFPNAIYSAIGERRGYRQVLKLLPEEE